LAVVLAQPRGIASLTWLDFPAMALFCRSTSSANVDPKRECGRIAKINTIDLQWKNDAICNVSPCKAERNAVCARAMGSNGKAMRRTMAINEEQCEDQ
jgi:hypothetical protein